MVDTGAQFAELGAVLLDALPAPIPENSEKRHATLDDAHGAVLASRGTGLAIGATAQEGAVLETTQVHLQPTPVGALFQGVFF